MMTRRAFVAAGVGSAALACACRRPARGPDRSEPPPGVPAPVSALLELASRAPSSHNSQPWKVAVQGGARLAVLADLSRRLPAVDPDDRELWISVGAFVEVLAAAARATGMSAGISAAAGGADPAAAVEVALAAGGPADAALERAIRLRRTLRKDLETRPLSAADRDGLAAAAGAGVRVRFLERGGREADWLAGAALAAMEAQTWRDAAQAELAEWVRFSREEEARRGDGLTPETMEVGALAGFWMRTFMDRSEVPGRRFRQAGIDGTRAQLAQGSGFLVISSGADDRPGRIEAGRAFARLGLEAVSRGIGLHPMSQVLEEPGWRERLSAEAGLEGAIQLILRAGYRAYPSAAVGPRRPVREFTVAA